MILKECAPLVTVSLTVLFLAGCQSTKSEDTYSQSGVSPSIAQQMKAKSHESRLIPAVVVDAPAGAEDDASVVEAVDKAPRAKKASLLVPIPTTPKAKRVSMLEKIEPKSSK